MRVRLRPWMLGTLATLLLLGLSFSTSQASSSLPRPASQDDSPGAAVFNRNCRVCHGTAASGKYGPPLNVIPPEIKNLPPEAIAQELTGLIRGGIPGYMPGFLPSQISDADVVPLVEYLLSNDSSVPSPQLLEAIAPITADQASGRTFIEATGHSVGGDFAAFWNRYGGLRVFGYPLSEEYYGVSPEDGKVYKMQLFERARMEMHPEAAAGEQVQLALVGAEELRLRTYFMSGQGPALPEGPPPGQDGEAPADQGGGG